eukprot:m.9473 g.9473  ORF g.9473 m.9473 type:complete len:454 (+) comp21377_c0_seq1:954-2315(+)
MYAMSEPDMTALRTPCSSSTAVLPTMALPSSSPSSSVTRPDALQGPMIPQISVTSDVPAAGSFDFVSAAAPNGNDDLINVLCGSFTAERERLGADPDPNNWSTADVQNWLSWAMKEFNLTAVDRELFRIDGRCLCRMTKAEFTERTPQYMDDILFSHIQHLQSTARGSASNLHQQQQAPPPARSSDYDVEALVNALGYDFSSSDAANARSYSPETPPKSPSPDDTSPLDGLSSWMGSCNSLAPPNRTASRQVPSPASSNSMASHSPYSSPQTSPCPSPNPKGPSLAMQAAMTVAYTESSGPIQLWQFLLELLTDKRNMDCIVWTGRGWEFKLTDPEVVAHRWGRRKNKPKMNYEKLSRGLRYYYDKNIIHKVPGKRYVYKFVCDLESLLGCTAQEMQVKYHAEVPTLPANPHRFKEMPPPYAAAVQSSSFMAQYPWSSAPAMQQMQQIPVNYY